jgi:hypothetical protein
MKFLAVIQLKFTFAVPKSIPAHLHVLYGIAGNYNLEKTLKRK